MYSHIPDHSLMNGSRLGVFVVKFPRAAAALPCTSDGIDGCVSGISVLTIPWLNNNPFRLSNVKVHIYSDYLLVLVRRDRQSSRPVQAMKATTAQNPLHRLYKNQSTPGSESKHHYQPVLAYYHAHHYQDCHYYQQLNSATC